MCGKSVDVMYLDREQLRLLADPIRQRVLKLLGTKEMSTSGLAAALGDQAPRNLYYHVHRLRAAGLIRLVRTEPRRGTVEKFYRAVAKVFAVKPELVVTMASDQAVQEDVVATARRVAEDTLHQFATSVARGLFTESMERVPPVVAGITIRASEDRLREIGERLHRWVADVSRERDDGTKMEYAGLVMFFPTELAPPADRPPPPGTDGS
jgi:DNA-binding transcriptional ArsR family regulator